jgi:hypothetical protein
MTKGRAILGWLLFLALNFLLDVIASWEQQSLATHRAQIGYLFAVVGMGCLYFHIRQEGTPHVTDIPGQLQNVGDLALRGTALVRPRIRRFFMAAKALTGEFSFAVTAGSLHPGQLVRSIGADTTAIGLQKALVFLAASTVLQAVTRRLFLQEDLWSEFTNSGARSLTVAVGLAITMHISWWVFRRRLSFGRAITVQIYAVAIAGLFLLFFTVLTHFIVATYSPTYESSRDFSSTGEAISVLKGCGYDDDFLSCISRHGVPMGDSVVMSSIIMLDVSLLAIIVWSACFWVSSRTLTNSGIVRGLSACMLWLLTSGVAFAGSLYLDSLAYEKGCGFGDMSRTPILNPGPLLYGATAKCGDLPFVDVGTHSSQGTLIGRRRPAASPEEHDTALVSKPGDTLTVRVFVDNGADPNIDSSVSTAIGVKVFASVKPVDDQHFVVTARASARNAPPIVSSNMKYGGDSRIETTVPSKLIYVPNSAEACVSQLVITMSKIPSRQHCSYNTDSFQIVLPDSGGPERYFNIGYLAPGYDYAVPIFFRLRVESIEAVAPHDSRYRPATPLR